MLSHESGGEPSQEDQLCWAGHLSCLWAALPLAGLSTTPAASRGGGGGAWGFEEDGAGRSSKSEGQSVACGLSATVHAHQWRPECRGQQALWLVLCREKKERVTLESLSFPPAWLSLGALAS